MKIEIFETHFNFANWSETLERHLGKLVFLKICHLKTFLKIEVILTKLLTNNQKKRAT